MDLDGSWWIDTILILATDQKKRIECKSQCVLSD